MKSICVYCGSSAGNRPEYAQAARALAHELARRGIRLVYGGSNVGIMGVLADAMLQAGGQVVGVIPQSLVKKEVAHSGLTALHITEDMHTRKAMMAELSDGFIALPGGLGTLEELFESLTWGQLGFHSKPVGVLNMAGYYDGLLAFLDHSVGEAFVKPQHRAMVLSDADASGLLDQFERYQPPQVAKWVAPGRAGN